MSELESPNKILVSWPSSDAPLPSEPGPAEYPGELRPNCRPFIRSNDLLGADGRIRDEAAAQELRRRSAACGYVFFEKLLPPQAVLEVRRAFVQILDDAGWLDAGREDALSTRATRTPLGTKLEGQEEYRPIMRAFQSLESFHALSRSPKLLGVLDALFDEPTFVHPRNIGRIILPQKNDFKTMPHQDWVHIQGCPNTITGWLPLGDVSVDDGGLAVLEGSSRYGVRRHWNKDLLGLVGGAGGISVTCKQLEERGCVWKTADYQAGDILLFNSLAIHQALPNLSDSIRLSCDFRYSGLSKEVVPDGLLPHGNIAPWPDLYRGESAGAGTRRWAGDSSQEFYWVPEGARPRLVERIPGYHVGEENDEQPQAFVNLGIAPPNRALDAEAVHAAIKGSMAGAELDLRKRGIVFKHRL